MKEAMFYSRRDGRVVDCRLCHQHCSIGPGRRGFCLVRENRDGVLYSLVYRKLIARHVDPIEKKPLFHFHPGSLSYSIATVGCNFRCLFCQNCTISQLPRDQNRIEGVDVAPEEIVADARARGCAGISYTYTEPTIFFEYAYDIMKLAREAGLANVWVSNGYITAEALEVAAPYMDAINVDLKSFNSETYKRLAQARLEPILETLKLYRPLGIWLEITTLVIPGVNDGEEELRAIAEFIASLGTDVPWHVSRFHPDYRMLDAISTPVATLRRAVQLGKEAGLKYVYSGNIPGDSNEHTFCPNCGEPVIERYGVMMRRKAVTNGACAYCGQPIDGKGLS
jgi:pyruvate formate lyase activating enzyme